MLATAEMIDIGRGEPDVFGAFDARRAQFMATPQEQRLYGRFSIGATVLLDAPPEVSSRGEHLTNPSQLEPLPGEPEPGVLGFAYFRQEPTTNHLGKTRSVPYKVVVNRDGTHLVAYEGATVLPGEDPRVTRGVRMRGLGGKMHTGWLISTTVATPEVENPERVKSTVQKVFWGVTLQELEQIGEGPEGQKNTTFCQAPGETRLHVLTRLFPHISYGTITSPSGLTPEAIRRINEYVITSDTVPEGFHVGPNFSQIVAPGHMTIDKHEARSVVGESGRRSLHYRLGRYGFALPTPGCARGRLVAVGANIDRSQFPEAAPRPSDANVESYHDVLYGSAGRRDAEYMLLGVADNRVGLAKLRHF